MLNFRCLLETGVDSYMFICSFIPVERIQNQWDEVQEHLQNRRQQLNEMLKDSTQWLEAKEEAEQVLGQARAKLESWREGPYTMDAIQKKITETKVSIKDVFWKSNTGYTEYSYTKD